MSKFNDQEKVRVEEQANDSAGSAGVGMQQSLTPSTSIDSVRLWCEDVALASDFAPYASQFKVVNRPHVKRRRVMLWHEGGEAVWGQSAVAISGDMVFRLACIDPCKRPQLSIWFSFPRWRWGHNASPVTQDDVANLIADINARAAVLGLSVDIGRAKITELHLCRDVVVERNFSEYLEILRAIEPPYGVRFKEWRSWILRGSKPNRWAIYDKTAQLTALSHGKGEKKTAGLLGLHVCQENIMSTGGAGLMRFEWRLLTANKIKTQLGFNNFGSLATADRILHEKFEVALQRDIFRWGLPDERVLQAWKELQERRDAAPTPEHRLLLGPAKMERVLAFEGWDYRVQRFGLEQTTEILKSASSSAEYKRFKGHLRQREHSMRMPCGLFRGQLYGELARAVLSSAKLEKLPRLVPVPKVSSKPKTRARKQA